MNKGFWGMLLFGLAEELILLGLWRLLLHP